MMQTQPAGIYIHVPFCVKRCRYCDFYSQTNLSLLNDFAGALIREIELAPDLGPVDTLYFGGGTPSLLDPAQIERIILSVRTRFTVSPDAEITIEANPGAVDAQRLPDFRAAGVNRLNLGIQSFDDRSLTFLGRIHTSADAARAIRAAGTAGFENLGLDLIYGLPGQTAADLRRDIEKAVSFNPEHLSCYLLTYEKGTLLDQQREEGSVVPLPEEDMAALFLLSREVLETSGYGQYEVSNF
ncbi:MAG: radical SAM family heme chaperone HemW, partial [Desulfobacterales bacterium]|nr:radical SAM family heme chaperone HemW [Desulfobacterales bacterium]